MPIIEYSTLNMYQVLNQMSRYFSFRFSESLGLGGPHSPSVPSTVASPAPRPQRPPDGEEKDKEEKEEKEEVEEEEEEKEEEGAQYIYNSPNSLLPIHKLCQT